jgi:hypothetical protein
MIDISPLRMLISSREFIETCTSQESAIPIQSHTIWEEIPVASLLLSMVRNLMSFKYFLILTRPLWKKGFPS